MNYAKVFFVTLTFTAQIVYGGNGVKGGDDISADFVNTIRNLPLVLSQKGLAEFPEVDFVKLQEATSDPQYRVELRSDLRVNGAFKDAVTLPEKLTQVNPNFWTAYSLMEDGAERKNVLAAHEIFVVMGLEDNDKYTISSRLYSKMSSLQKTILSVGRITPADIHDPSIIDVINYSDRTSTFAFCGDRNDSSTCLTLGRLSHPYSQVNYVSLHVQLLQKLKYWTQARNYAALGSAAAGAGLGSTTEATDWKASVQIGAFFGGLIGGLGTMPINIQVNALKEFVTLTSPQLLQGESVVFKRMEGNYSSLAGQFQELLQWID